MPPNVASLLHRDLIAGTPENDDSLDRISAGKSCVDVFLERNDPAAAIAAVGGNNSSGAAVSDSIPDRVRAEAAEDY